MSSVLAGIVTNKNWGRQRAYSGEWLYQVSLPGRSAGFSAKPRHEFCVSARSHLIQLARGELRFSREGQGLLGIFALLIGLPFDLIAHGIRIFCCHPEHFENAT